MSAADQHRHKATNHLDHALTETPGMRPVLATMAVASALLAIEARLGELVDGRTLPEEPHTACEVSDE